MSLDELVLCTPAFMVESIAPSPDLPAHAQLPLAKKVPQCSDAPVCVRVLCPQVKGPKKELSRKDKKKKEKERAARKARGEEVTDSEDDM